MDKRLFKLLEAMQPVLYYPNGYDLPAGINYTGNCTAFSYIEEGCLYLIAEFPGLEKKDLNLSISDKAITLTGAAKNKYKNAENYNKVRGFINNKEDFKVVLDLEVKVDVSKTETSYENGVAKVKIPLDLTLETKKTFKF